MSNIPNNLLYTDSHEWLLREGDDVVMVGISDHAQELLGDIVFVELPEEGTEVSQGEECCVIESVKTAADVYAPVSGTVTEVNESLLDAPSLVNKDAYGDGWLFKLKISDANELSTLSSPEDYNDLIEKEEDED